MLRTRPIKTEPLVAIPAWYRRAIFVALLASGCSQPSAHAGAQPPPTTGAPPSEINFAKAAPVDEEYRAQFLECDQRDVFRGIAMEKFQRCSGDPNNLVRLVRFPKIDGLPGVAIAFTSKLGVDYDGSWVAAHTPGMTDQKDTSKEYPGPNGQNVPTDSDSIPYIVIPNAGHADSAIRNGFTTNTGVKLGDLGVVLFQGHVVPVVVADGGPFNKIGEGSVALHRALGREFCLSRNAEGTCVKLNPSPSSIEGGVSAIIFTDSQVSGITAASLAKVTNDQGMRLFGIFQQTYGTSP
jgi:hypothetical protein